MIRKLAAIALGIFAVLGCSPAMAANCADISVSPATPSIPTWNPINPAAQEQAFQVVIVRTNSSSRSARLIFLDSNSAATPTRVQTTTGPRYQIINTNSGATVSFPSGTLVTGQTVATTNLPNGSGGNSVTVNLKVQILSNSSPTEDFVGGTMYSEALSFAIQCFQSNGTTSNGIDNATASGLTVSLTIPKLISIVTASPSPINFGNFSATSAQSQITVKSTSTLNVSVTSSSFVQSSLTQLVRSGAVTPYPANSVIPYTMKFNNVTIAPGTPLANHQRAGVSGSDYTLLLTLPATPSGKLAGSYNDTVTLTIQPGI